MELNKVFLVGNLARGPETRYLPSGDAISEFDIGVNRSYRDRQGERQQETAWVRISAFGRLSEFASNYLSKGKAVFVEGRLRHSSWETPDGQRHSRLDVVAERVQFAYPRGYEDAGGGGAYGGGAAGSGGPGGPAPASRRPPQQNAGYGDSGGYGDAPPRRSAPPSAGPPEMDEPPAGGASDDLPF